MSLEINLKSQGPDEKGTHMLKALRTRLLEIPRLKVYVCKRSSDLTGPGIIFFPIFDDMLFCGLAGFVTIKGTIITTGDNGVPERISASIGAVCSNGISKLVSGKITSDGYLEPEALQTLENELHCLKQDTCLQYALCCGNGMTHLKKLSDILSAFIDNEDSVLEKEAKEFPSGDLEVIA